MGLVTLYAKLLEFINADSATDSASVPAQQTWLMRASGLFLILLVGATWRLWFASGVASTAYPSVPLLEIGRQIPSWMQTALAGLLLVTALCWMVSKPDTRTFRIASIVFAVAVAGLMISNQHRVQPWLYQLVLISSACVLLKPRDCMVLCRLLLVSIYLFSAFSKFDHQFLHTLGQQFLWTLTNLIGVSPKEWSEPLKLLLAAAFPLAELAIALGLLMPRCRRWAAYGAVALHVGLLLVLGPLGLGHQWAVLLWNLFFIVQVVILFGLHTTPPHSVPQEQPTAAEDMRDNSPTTAVGLRQLVALLIVASPALEPLGLIDHWPAWQVYAPRNSRVRLLIMEERAEQMTPEMKPFLKPTAEGWPWLRVDLDAWSLATTSAPIYPQDRFQLGVAMDLIERQKIGSQFKLIQQSASNRITGERKDAIARTTFELEAMADAFRFNARPSR